MITQFKIRTIDGQIYRFHNKEINHYDFDYNSEVIRFDFKDGSFVEFYKRNVVYVEAIVESEEE